MDDCRDLLEEPLMGTVAKEEHVWVRIDVLSQFAPPLGYDGANAYLADGLEEDLS